MIKPGVKFMDLFCLKNMLVVGSMAYLLPQVGRKRLLQRKGTNSPSQSVWVVSGSFIWITVRISCGRPGRISPVEALKYHGVSDTVKTYKRGMDSSHRIMSMAFEDLSRNRGKTVLVVLSISFCAVLVSVICLLLAVCISAMTDRVWNQGSIVELLRETE